MHAPWDAAHDAGLNFRLGGGVHGRREDAVVTGVAVIILVGLAIWWVRALNTLNTMKETTSETPTS